MITSVIDQFHASCCIDGCVVVPSSLPSELNHRAAHLFVKDGTTATGQSKCSAGIQPSNRPIRGSWVLATAKQKLSSPVPRPARSYPSPTPTPTHAVLSALTWLRGVAGRCDSFLRNGPLQRASVNWWWQPCCHGLYNIFSFFYSVQCCARVGGSTQYSKEFYWNWILRSLMTRLIGILSQALGRKGLGGKWIGWIK
jgi:hypothetical protein